MADVHTKAQRSFNMSRIKSGKTTPELKFKALLKQSGIKGFRERIKNIPGKPDFYFPKQGIAIFIDGCFWHKCKKCFKEPSSNSAFWYKKITANTTRDRKITRLLINRGLHVVRIWEHDLGKNDKKIVINLKKIISEKK